MAFMFIVKFLCRFLSFPWMQFCNFYDLHVPFFCGRILIRIWLWRQELETFALRDKTPLCRYDLEIADYVNSDAVNVTENECEALRNDGSSIEVLKDYGAAGCLIKILQWREGYGSCPKLPINPTYESPFILAHFFHSFTPVISTHSITTFLFIELFCVIWITFIPLR